MELHVGSVMVRIFAYAGAITLCFLLYRFGKGAWNNHNRSRNSQRDGRSRNSRKDINYTRLALGEQYDDEDEGYHDNDPRMSLQKPLPDKPLPPIPASDLS
jgi:hypothetical protein